MRSFIKKRWQRSFTIDLYNYPIGKKCSQRRRAQHFYLSQVREKNLERSTRELFMKNYFRKKRIVSA